MASSVVGIARLRADTLPVAIRPRRADLLVLVAPTLRVPPGSVPAKLVNKKTLRASS